MHLQVGSTVPIGKKGLLVMLFTEYVDGWEAQYSEKMGDEKITFVFQFVPGNDSYFTRNLEEGAKKLFSDVSVKFPIIDSETFHRNPNAVYACLVFTRTVKAWLRRPDRYLHATKNKLQKLVEWAELEASSQAEAELFEELM